MGTRSRAAPGPHVAGSQRRGLAAGFLPIDKLTRISLRIETLDVPPQDVITRDNVSVKVNAVCYFRVMDANLALSQVQNYLYATSQLAQTTLRSLVGQFELDAILSEREKVNAKLQQILDQDTEPWGIKVTKVEVKQVDIPENMQRAIARQAEAERERARKSFTPRANTKPRQSWRMRPKCWKSSPPPSSFAICRRSRKSASRKTQRSFFRCRWTYFSVGKALGDKRIGRRMARQRKTGRGDRVLESRHLVGLFLGVVILCAVFFTLGYVMGRSHYALVTFKPSAPSGVWSARSTVRKCPASAAAQGRYRSPAGEWDFYAKQNNNNWRAAPAPKAAEPEKSVVASNRNPEVPAWPVSPRREPPHVRFA